MGFAGKKGCELLTRSITSKPFRDTGRKFKLFYLPKVFCGYDTHCFDFKRISFTTSWWIPNLFKKRIINKRGVVTSASKALKAGKRLSYTTCPSNCKGGSKIMHPTANGKLNEDSKRLTIKQKINQIIKPIPEI